MDLSQACRSGWKPACYISILHQRQMWYCSLNEHVVLLLTQVTLLSIESRELLLERVVVLRGSRDKQQSPLRHESEQQ